jgi:hypothetical protein
LSNFSAKVGRADIFKQPIWNGSSHEISNDNGVRAVNFATSKNLVVKSTMFPHRSIHKYSWISPDGMKHNQIYHILLDRRRFLSILDVSDHYLVVAIVGERLAVGKRPVNKMNAD